MRILLACGAGLSTSILMKKMEKYCEDKGHQTVHCHRFVGAS